MPLRQRWVPRTLSAVVALALAGVALGGLSHSQDGANLGSLYPEGWRMVDRFAGFRFECTGAAGTAGGWVWEPC